MECRNASEDGQAGRAVDEISQGSSRVHARCGRNRKKSASRKKPGRIHADRQSRLMTQTTCRFQPHGNCTEPWALQSDGMDPDIHIKKQTEFPEKKENKPWMKVWI